MNIEILYPELCTLYGDKGNMQYLKLCLPDAEFVETTLNAKPLFLTEDIDLTEYTKEGGIFDTGNGWTPINNFTGTFDRNEHRIIGMHIYGDLDIVGLRNITKIGVAYERFYDN